MIGSIHHIKNYDYFSVTFYNLLNIYLLSFSNIDSLYLCHKIDYLLNGF